MAKAQLKAKKPTAKYTPLIIDVRKLAILSLLTANLYQLYWFYRQWQAVLPTGTKIWRLLTYTIFSGISSFGLFKRLKAPYAPSLATAYLILPVALSTLPLPYTFLSYVAIMVPIVLVQQSVNAQQTAEIPPISFSARDLILVLIGLAFIVYSVKIGYR